MLQSLLNDASLATCISYPTVLDWLKTSLHNCVGSFWALVDLVLSISAMFIGMFSLAF